MRYGNAWLCLLGTISLLGSAPSVQAGTDVIVHSFGAPGSNDGVDPQAGTISVAGVLYGTTLYGGAHGGGTVYSFNPSGQYRVIHSFPATPEGSGGPVAGLTYKNGLFYGTTVGGGDSFAGSVFSITATGVYKLIHSFSGPEGENPSGPVINYGGTLYGTASGGGSYGLGTIYGISPDGNVQVLHSFSGYMPEQGVYDGEGPSSGLTPFEGSFFGCTSNGGIDSAGILFGVTPSGQYNVVHIFERGKFVPATGFTPYGGLVSANGILYGMTLNSTPRGTSGAIYGFNPIGQAEFTLKFFGSGQFNGYSPVKGLTYYDGLLYGTTQGTLGSRQYGNVFSIDTNGNGTTIYRFRGGADGASPTSNVSRVDGNLYVTTAGGGAYGAGTLAMIKP